MNLDDLRKQLEIIYACAPGPHEIRVIGRRYKVKVSSGGGGREIEGVLMNAAGTDEQSFGLGNGDATKVTHPQGDWREELWALPPTNPQQVIDLIRTHYNDEEPHNCFIVANQVADIFRLGRFAPSYDKIGYQPKSVAFTLTKAQDIVGICCLPLDIDRADTPKDEQGRKLAASEEELQNLDQLRLELVRDISQYGLTPSYQICSGNGYQVVYFFESQTEMEARRKALSAIDTILEGLHEKYRERMDVDIKLKDLSRVVRLAGIYNKKQDRKEEPEHGRIYRLATLVESLGIPNQYANVLKLAEAMKIWQEEGKKRETEQKKAQTEQKKAQKVSPVVQNPQEFIASNFTKEGGEKREGERGRILSSLPVAGTPFAVRTYLAEHGVTIKNEKSWMDGTFLLLRECVFDSSHTDGEAGILVHSGGKLSYKCFHNSCQGRTWHDLRAKLGDPVKPTRSCRFCQQEIERRGDGKWYGMDGTLHRCLSAKVEVAVDAEADKGAKSILESLESLRFKSFDEFKVYKEGLRTGYAFLDSYITIPPAAITICAARPGHGKTSFMLNLLTNMMALYPQLMFSYFTYEELPTAIILKLLIIRSMVVFDRKKNIDFVRNYLRGVAVDQCPVISKDTEQALGKLDKAKDEIMNLIAQNRLRVYGVSMRDKELSEAIRQLAQQYPIGAVFVDYIQKIRPSERAAGTRQLALQGVSECMLDTAKFSNIPLVIGCQLGRDKEHSNKVRLDNLREAGDFEQDANLVLGLNNLAKGEDKDNVGTEEIITDLEVTILKNREGLSDKMVTLTLHQPTFKIGEKALPKSSVL